MCRAANEFWDLDQIECVDISEPMVAAAKSLLAIDRPGAKPLIPNVNFKRFLSVRTQVYFLFFFLFRFLH